MSRTRTLTEMIADVRFQADLQGFTVRHTDADITRLLNQAVNEHRRDVSLEGVTNYLAVYSSTFTAGNTSPHKFGVLDLSSGPNPALVHLYGLDLVINDEQRTLHAVSLSERSDYGGSPAEPEAWAPMTAYKYAIFPAPATAYTYIAHYLPKFTDLATGSDTFDGVEGYEDDVLWRTVVRLIARDQFPTAFQMAVQERERATAKCLATAKQQGKGVIHRRRDTWGARRRDVRERRRPPWRA